jgi:hypothetical protein
MYVCYMFRSSWIIIIRQFHEIYYSLPITVAARSVTSTAFAILNAGIVGSNPTQGMYVCVRLFCVVLDVGSSLTTGRSPVQGVLLTVYGLRN